MDENSNIRIVADGEVFVYVGADRTVYVDRFGPGDIELERTALSVHPCPWHSCRFLAWLVLKTYPSFQSSGGNRVIDVFLTRDLALLNEIFEIDFGR
jgi:hypothetical protein